MELISQEIIQNYYKKNAASKKSLEIWASYVRSSKWRNPAEIKQMFASASILKSGRVVFNIKGNDYRLISSVDYITQTLSILWIGTHAEYDKIDAENI